ncbi:MAG TPA: phage baseplate assembly protein, partial [Kofleriaceae bacterium]|nr:phage baseplate assembly protein [Kofleriaceae bacterium]
MSKDFLRDLNHHVMRPIANRIANSIARCVVQLVSDEKTLQALQIGVLSGETIDHAEHYQPYGFTSVPLPGSSDGVPEGVVVFPNGDRSHPLVVVVSDRRHRPTGGQPG